MFKKIKSLKIDHKKVNEELDELKDSIELEKNDTLALIIAALTTFLPIVLIFYAIIIFVTNLIIPLF